MKLLQKNVNLMAANLGVMRQRKLVMRNERVGGLYLFIAKADLDAEFFETFWSLQRFFSRPPNLALPGAFDKFKAAVNSVLPVISEANKKERLLMGSKAKIGSAGAKRKREPLVETPADYRHDYFFAKFLTSPDLLELEVSNGPNRRYTN
jgi:hypothetical protein